MYRIKKWSFSYSEMMQGKAGDSYNHEGCQNDKTFHNWGNTISKPMIKSIIFKGRFCKEKKAEKYLGFLPERYLKRL